MEGVRKRFGPTVALDGVRLTAGAGEIVGLVGENGAGKSTLMKVLSGAVRPDEGDIWLDGVAYRPRDPADGRRAGVAMVYQELSLAPHLSLAENILLGIEPAAGPLLRWGEMRRRAGEALRAVGHGDLPLDVPAGRLSPAAQQLVEIARGLALGSRVLILDEPTSSLTLADVRRLFELVRRLRDGGHAVVYISHALEEVRELCDRFVVLRDGRTVGEGQPGETPTEQIVSMMVGRRVEELYPRSPRVPGEVLLELTDVCGERLPQGASLRVRRGEVVGLAGLIGAGRTELLRAIFGLDAVRSGTVRVGAYVGGGSPAVRWRQGAGMLSEDRAGEGLALGLSVAENVTLARPRGAGPAGLVTPGSQREAARPWIERLRIRCLRGSQPVRELSGGNQQKVALARLLHADVDLLLLDEPTRGIDVGSKAEIYRLIDRLACGSEVGRPRAVLVVSSYFPELLGLCDRIAVMRRGRLGPLREAGGLSEHELLLEATGATQER